MSQKQTIDNYQHNLSFRKILKTWLPLVGSWMMMSIERPAINAILARLENPEIHIAAFGSVVSSIAMMISAPLIMLLAASTALSCDWQSYKKLQRYTLYLGAALSGLTLIVVVTPLYYFIVNVLLHVPQEIVEPGRLGLICLIPWSVCIGYRRFQQGAMIHFGHSNIVGEVTIVRLSTVGIVLTIGMIVKTIPGALLAGLAQGLGVLFEAIYTGFRVQTVLPEIKAAPRGDKELTLKRFVRFYFPLGLTSFITLLWTPLISAAVSRMPDPLESLAVWSVVMSFSSLFRTAGMAYNEVVVALLKKPENFPVFRRFTRIASLTIMVIVIVIVATPLSVIWYSFVANLPPDQIVIARTAMALEIPLGFVSTYISFYQGIVVNHERTGWVAEATFVFLVSLILVLILGILIGSIKGVYVASASTTFAFFMQAVWLMWRSRKQRRLLLLEASGLS